MPFFKYGFIFLAGAGVGAAVAHRGQHCCSQRHGGGHCWRRHWGHRGHELEPGQQASHDDDHGRSRVHYAGAAGRDTTTEEGEYRSLKKKKNKKSADAAAAMSD